MVMKKEQKKITMRKILRSDINMDTAKETDQNTI